MIVCVLCDTMLVLYRFPFCEQGFVLDSFCRYTQDWNIHACVGSLVGRVTRLPITAVKINSNGQIVKNLQFAVVATQLRSLFVN